MKIRINIILLMFLFPLMSWSQKNVVAGELDIQERINDTIHIRVRLYTVIDSTVDNDSLSLLWGDYYGLETIPRTYKVPINQELQMEVYEAKRYYDFTILFPTSTFFIELWEMQLSHTITNWDMTNDTLPRGYIGCFFDDFQNTMLNPYPSYRENNLAISSTKNDTAIVHTVELDGMEGDILEMFFSHMITHPSYTYPGDAEDFIIQDSSFIWRYPQQTGRFIFVVYMREHMASLPHYHRVLMPRLIMIDVDSAFNVTTYETFVESEKLSFYPNPTVDGLVQVELKNRAFEPFSIEIYNEIGQLVKQLYTANTTIDISELQSGLYIFKSTLNDKTYINKVLKI